MKTLEYHRTMSALIRLDAGAKGERPRMRSKNPTRLCWLALLMTAIAAYAFVNRPISSSIEWGDDIEAALSSARQGHTRVVLEFSASWCGYCRLMEREVLTNPKVGL